MNLNQGYFFEAFDKSTFNLKSVESFIPALKARLVTFELKSFFLPMANTEKIKFEIENTVVF